MADQTTITCPHCGHVFPIDDSGYSALLAQVRDAAFQKEVEDRSKLLEQAQAEAIRAVEERTKLQAADSAKEAETALRSRIAELEAQAATQQEVAAAHAAEREGKLSARIAELESALKSQKDSAATAQELAVTQAVAAMKEERDALANQIQLAEAQAKQAASDHAAQLAKEEHAREELLRIKDEEIERLRDMKAKLSTKMLGESLEQHCETEFNKIRAFAFPRAQFGKDNSVVEGTKGDYIFRESSEDDIEFISIMFEMKNESDSKSTKHKNADFFAKLDKDRRKKNCEYAILVSLLEAESEYYNQGIVEVSDYEKMYVIRPQFFIPIIGLLRNMALSSLADRKQLALLQNRDYDIAKFEDKLDKFRSGFGKNMEMASRKFEAAIKDIDKTIATMQKVRDELLSSQRALDQAGNKVEGLTVKRLTHGNPTMKQKFIEAREASQAEEDEEAYRADDDI